MLDDELVDLATAVVSDALAAFTLALDAQQVQAAAALRLALCGDFTPAVGIIAGAADS